MYLEKATIVDSHWSVNQIGFEELVGNNFDFAYPEYLNKKIVISFRQLGFTRKFRDYNRNSKELISICDNNRYYGKLKEDTVIYFHKSKLIYRLLNCLVNPGVKWIKAMEFIPVKEYGVKIGKGTLVDHELYGNIEKLYDCHLEILNFLRSTSESGLSTTYITNDGFSDKPGSYVRSSKMLHSEWINGLASSLFFLPTHKESGGLTMLEHLIQGGVLLIYKGLMNHVPLDNYKQDIDYFIFENEPELTDFLRMSFDPTERSLSFRERYYASFYDVIEYLYEI